MKSKTPLVLMEQLVMVLVFALAAALCLRCFVLSDRLSERNALRDEAVLAAQTAAEALKGCGGDYGRTAQMLGGKWNDGRVSVHTEGKYTLMIVPENSGDPLLGSARVEVYSVQDDALLFDLTVAWQEVYSYG